MCPQAIWALLNTHSIVGLLVEAWPNCAICNTNLDDQVGVLVGRTLVHAGSAGVLGNEIRRASGHTGSIDILGVGAPLIVDFIPWASSHTSPRVIVSKVIGDIRALQDTLVGRVISEVGLRAVVNTLVGGGITEFTVVPAHCSLNALPARIDRGVEPVGAESNTLKITLKRKVVWVRRAHGHTPLGRVVPHPSIVTVRAACSAIIVDVSVQVVLDGASENTGPADGVSKTPFPINRVAGGNAGLSNIVTEESICLGALRNATPRAVEAEEERLGGAAGDTVLGHVISPGVVGAVGR